MAPRKAIPLKFVPLGISDTPDSTSNEAGRMQQLSNLIPFPGSRGIFTPRPGAIPISDLTAHLNTPTQVTAFIMLGTRLYGMASTALNAGKDQPFCYDFATNAYIAISGITNANSPTSPASSGAWTPPQMVVISTKIIVTHTGFSGAGTNFFGVLDISNPAAPAWSAQNTTVNALTAVPSAVGAFNGRAWFANGNTVTFSDSLNPTVVTNASQRLTIGDSTDVTAFAGQPFQSTQQGGIIQSLIIFKAASTMFQVTGDQTTANLVVNEIKVETGTLAPNSIASTPRGLCFVSPDGVRILDAQGNVSEPIGADGQGIVIPFQNAVTPSRMCAAYNQGVLRLTVQNGNISSQPYQEYWFDFSLGEWSGPHSSTNSLIESYFAGAGGFVHFLLSQPLEISQSNPTPTINSSFAEAGAQLTWVYQTSLLPDNEQMVMNQMSTSSVMIAPGLGSQFTVQFVDDHMNILDTVVLTEPGVPGGQWGGFNWGQSNWGGTVGNLYQHRIPWHQPLVFKQGSMIFSGNSGIGVKVGNLYMLYQTRGYLLPVGV